MSLAVGGIGAFQADKLAVFIALVSALVRSIIVFYSWGYIEKYEHRDEYYLVVVLFLGAMMGLVFAENLVALYLFWEITAVASWRLIGLFRAREHVRRADKAFLISLFGAVTMLLGFVVVYAKEGTFDLLALRWHHLSNLAVGLILVGVLSKSAARSPHAMKWPGRVAGEVLRHLSQKPATVLYPFEKVEMPAAFRDKNRYVAERCVGCRLCQRDCPASALTINKVGEKRFEAVFRLDKCIYCAQCVDSCNKDAIESTPEFELATLDRGALRVVYHAPEPPRRASGEARPAAASAPAVS